MEKRTVEIRAEGRRLKGVALPYQSVSPGFRERFLPGSIEISHSVALNLHHNKLQAVAFHPGGGLEFRDTDSALEFSAELLPIPASHIALERVRSGRYSGASVEFVPLREHRDRSGIRVIEKAKLTGLALTHSPGYEETSVELRRRKAGGRARVRPMPDSIRKCSCVGPNCDSVKFAESAFDKAIEQAQSGQRNIVLHTGSLDPAHVVATTFAGSLLLSRGDDGSIEAEITQEAMESPAGEMLAESVETSAPIVRPLIDEAESEFTEDGNVRTYTLAAITALLVKVSRNDPTGWDPFELLRRSRKRRIRSLLL